MPSSTHIPENLIERASFLENIRHLQGGQEKAIFIEAGEQFLDLRKMVGGEAFRLFGKTGGEGFRRHGTVCGGN